MTPRDPDSTPPFPKHHTYYVILKWVVLAVALLVAFKLLTGYP